MYKRGDIVLVPFPFSDLSGQKIRPALVLSARSKTDTIVVFITSQYKPKTAYVVQVAPTNKNGLKQISMVVCDKIATLDIKIILGSIGELEEERMRDVGKIISRVIGTSE